MARAILAINEAFGRMSAWCSRTTSCALHGRNVGAAYDAAVRKVPVTKLLVPLMFAAGQNPTIGWPAVTKMIAQASRGDMTTLNALTKASSEARGNQPEDPQLVAGQTGLYAGVVCADYGPENDYDKLVAGGQIVGREAPRFAWRYWDSTPLAHMGPGSLDCTGWAHPATNPPHVLRVGWHRNVMVANPAHDTSTTLTNAMSIHKQIPGAVFLIADVDGHQSLVNSQCAFEYMQKFWNDPRSVGAAIVCHN
ncbi:MAG TPA: alpha/beta hydrolase, partial [Candidatus Cybelea sp.]